MRNNFKDPVSLEERLAIVTEVREGGKSVAKASVDHDISYATVRFWVRKFDAYGLEGLAATCRENRHTSKRAPKKDLPPVEELDIPIEIFTENIEDISDVPVAKKSTGPIRKAETVPLEERLAIVAEVASGKTVSKASVDHNVSYAAVRSWTRRFEDGGEEGLAATLRKRRPKRLISEDEGAYPEGKGSKRKCQGKGPSDQLCWTCQHAVPIPDKDLGCEWSRHLDPVPGWEAEILQTGHGEAVHILSCPKYLPDIPREVKKY